MLTTYKSQCVWNCMLKLCTKNNEKNYAVLSHGKIAYNNSVAMKSNPNKSRIKAHYCSHCALK